MPAVMAGDADDAIGQGRARCTIGRKVSTARRISSSLTCFKRSWNDATSPPLSASFSGPKKFAAESFGGEIR
jgi:hypothetical protein